MSQVGFKNILTEISEKSIDNFYIKFYILLYSLNPSKHVGEV